MGAIQKQVSCQNFQGCWTWWKWNRCNQQFITLICYFYNLEYVLLLPLIVKMTHVLEWTCDGRSWLHNLCRLRQKSLKVIFTRLFGLMSNTLQADACNFPPFPMFICVTNNTHVPYIPPVPTCGSIWVVLWLFCFRSTPSMFPQ